MRRRRQLKVDTSPFLAVLLCAMGSLIFVLLVMDRRARLAAQERVSQTIAEREDRAKQRAEAERAARELARHAALEEWERKRQALHNDLAQQHNALTAKVKAIEEELRGSDAKVQTERARLADLQHQLRDQQSAVEAERRALAERQAKVGQTESKDEAARQALAKMQQQLGDLEAVLRNLTTKRTEEKSAYSVVPYRGKFGEARKPLYIECAKDVVIFHPEGAKFTVPIEEREVRNEVNRRIGKRTEIERKVPYLLLMIRPTGILTYYELLDALDGLPIEFGYELIDNDWKLRVPTEPVELPTPSPPRGVGPALGRPALGTGSPPPPPAPESPPPRKSPVSQPTGTASPASPKPRGLGHAELGAERRDFLFVECRSEGVVLYPNEERLNQEVLSKPAAQNPLVQAVQKMIERRKADLHEHRDAIQVRFLVRPDGFRAFHQAYPLLEKLPVSKIRQNLDADTNVLTVIQETH